MAGASWVQKEILDKNPDTDLQIYSIWLPMLLSDQVSRAGVNELSDLRVKHYWDEEKTVGKWFAEQWGYQGATAWDVYLLYGQEAVWDSLPGPVASWGNPVISEKEKLIKDFQALIGE